MVNDLLSVWSTVGSVLLAVLILLVMITVHEFGHWVVGKILKFRIDEFSIGFGPALFKKKKKNGEIFALRLIPLGGYCAFHGEDGEEAPDPFLDAKEQDPFEAAEEELKRAEEGGETLAPEQAGAAQQEVLFAETGEPVPAPEEVAPAPKKRRRIPEWRTRPDDGSFTRKAPWKRLLVLVAGALMNYLLALVLILVCFFAYGQGMLGAARVERGEDVPAEYLAYSLQDGDVFLEAEGKKLYLSNDLALALNGRKAGDLVTLRISRITGEDEAGKNVRTVMDVKIMLRSDVTVKNSAQVDSAWKALGIKYEATETGGRYALGTRVMRFGFGETIGRSFVYSFKIAGSILRVLGELLTGKIGLSAMGGPVSTISITSQVASSGFRNFLEISGFIGVNLAVFNLLPIPALDGSKFVFTVIEWIRGKPISRKIEAIIHAAGFIFLLGFAILVDVLQFV